MSRFNYALIMAAGRGIRMMPLTKSIPKAMAPFNGTTLIANGIEKIKESVPNIYITVGYKGSDLAKHVIEHNVSGIFNTSCQDNAWWIFNTLLKFVDEPVVVLTCDNVVVLDFEILFKEYTYFGSPACMLVPVLPIKGLEGDYIFHNQNKVYKLSRTEKNDTYCSGIQIINPAEINKRVKGAYNFYEVWEQLSKEDHLFCSNQYPKEWLTVDTMEQLQHLNYRNSKGQ